MTSLTTNGSRATAGVDRAGLRNGQCADELVRGRAAPTASGDEDGASTDRANARDHHERDLTTGERQARCAGAFHLRTVVRVTRELEPPHRGSRPRREMGVAGAAGTPTRNPRRTGQGAAD